MAWIKKSQEKKQLNMSFKGLNDWLQTGGLKLKWFCFYSFNVVSLQCCCPWLRVTLHCSRWFQTGRRSLCSLKDSQNWRSWWTSLQNNWGPGILKTGPAGSGNTGSERKLWVLSIWCIHFPLVFISNESAL